MSWESLNWEPASGQSLGAGASVLTFWPMLQSAISESIAGDALCPVTLGELGVAHVASDDIPMPLQSGSSFELLGTDRRGSWAALDPAKGEVLGGKTYAASRLLGLVLEGMEDAFEALIGEGLSLGEPLDLPAAGTPLILVRLPIVSANEEEVTLISAYDEAVADELAAHVMALQALGSQSASAPPSATAPSIAPTAATAPSAAPSPTPAAAAYGSGLSPAPGPGNGHNGNGGLPPLPSNVRPAELPELTPGPGGNGSYNIDLLLGVNLQVAVEIGRTTLAIRDVLALTPGSIIELDKLAGEKVDILINGRPIAQGEIVVVDENFGVRITDVVARQQRLTPTGR